MQSRRFAPSWAAAVSGYTWQPVKAARMEQTTGGFVLRLKHHMVSKATKWNFFNLLELNPMLFWDFASLDQGFEGIKEFASQFGFLRTRAWMAMQFREPGLVRKPAESYREWLIQIQTMKNVKNLWSACEEDDQKTLAEYIRWESDREVTISIPPCILDEKPTRTLVRIDKLLADKVSPGDLVVPAAMFIQECVNRYVPHEPHVDSETEGAQPKLLVQLGTGLGPDTFRFRYGVHPSTLQEALWLQAANFLSLHFLLKKCEECGNWFMVASKAPRTRLVYCSNACRASAHRERQNKARQMAADGKSFQVIAKALGSDPATIKGWVTGIRRQ